MLYWPQTRFNTYADHPDVFIELGNEKSIAEMGQALYQEVLAVASGKQTKAEIIG